MFNHTYETTACSAYPLREIKIALQKAKINGELETVTTSKGHRLRDIVYVTPYSRAIPPFHHPLAFEDVKGKQLIAVDQRPNMALTRTDERKITQTSSYDFLNLRAALEYLWTNGYRQDLQSLGQVPFRTFVRLISESIVRRLGLTPDLQQAIAAMAGHYYQCLFMEDTDLSDDDKLKVAVRNRNYLAIPTDVTLSLIDGLAKPVCGSLPDFCNALTVAIPNPRIEKINPAFMISISAGVWFGNAAKEVVAASLEYPPAFLAMVFTALNDRSMHAAQLSKLVDSVARGNTGAEFNAGMKAYLENTYDV